MTTVFTLSIICRLLVSSTVIFTSFLYLIFSANANGSEPILNAPVLVTCNLFGVSEGKLAVNSNNTVLSSNASGGIPATMLIDCNGAASLQVDRPQQTNIQTNTTEFLPGNLSATATINSLIINSPDNIAIPVDADGEVKGEITVNMQAIHETPISPGEYSFTVTLTAIPN